MTIPVSSADAQPATRQRLSFNADWRFRKGDPADAGEQLGYARLRDWFLPTGNAFVKLAEKSARPSENPGADVSYIQPNFDDSGWRKLDLPHDWGIEGPFQQEYSGETGKLPWWGIGWYRKRFTLPAEDTNKKIFLDIDGAMSYASVWLNGKLVGGWPYGYSSFRLDLTPFIRPGSENVLAIRLDNPNDSSRWYPGGGIYRNVWLVKTAPVHVAHWGTYITTPEVSAGAVTVDIQTTLSNDSPRPAVVRLVSTILDADNKRVAEISQADITLSSGETQTLGGRIAFKTPRLWSLKNPYRYKVVTTVEQDKTVLDRYETPFGIRTIAWDKAKGFILNGERVPIQGVCNHHDLGALGAAINIRAMERQIEILKEMGCNAIRTSHNPPAPELLDLCDRMGILVMDEFVDVWKGAKKPNGYQVLFDDWSEQDLRALVRRDRNHPCVILWSTGNEIRELGSPGGAEVSRRLTAIVRDEDPTRLVSLGANDTRAGYNGFQTTVDAFGYNYKPGEYGKFRAANPDLPLFGSETASTVSSRGEYFFPVTDDKSGGKADFQVSSYDLYAPSWAMPPDTEFRGQDQNPSVAGEFVWTGFDYLGEPTPYNSDSSNLLNFFDPAEKARAEKELKELGKIRVPSRSSYFGIVDLAGFKKDRFYLYQARWRPDLPMAHILPHWNWPDRIGQVTPVHVYTSGDEAELFLNGKSLGRKKRGQYEYRLRWDDVVYQPGELRVVAYKDGRKWADSTVKTTGSAARVTMKADRSILKADGADLAFVTVSIADTSGTMVPRSENRVRFEIEGPGEIIATDNGDATSFESFQSPERNAFNGLALVIVRTKKGQAGTIRLKGASAGLTDAVITLTTK
ncbi:MAG: beta-galactosidase GalB [Armatimonadota bacterium]